VSCWITHTSERTHDIIRGALDRSPLYTGKIEGVGPRYCPSIEDKVVRFAEKSAHQIFIEPEGLTSHEIYPNGISTSLPLDVQVALVRSIKGFERAHLTRPGYAIEYDYFDPRGLKPSLETRAISGLWFAGQINGTTGYEEAAAQGLVAGINAARAVHVLAPWSPTRAEAYLGVLIDDLVTNGTTEPYRMFTSRAEYRLQLREDNADLRLTELGRALGCVTDARWDRFWRKRDAIEHERARLRGLWAGPGNALGRAFTETLGVELARETHGLDLLRRPELDYAKLMRVPGLGPGVAEPEVAQQVEVQQRYAGYLERQREEIERQRAHEDTPIPAGFDFAEVRGTLRRGAPETRARASGQHRARSAHRGHDAGRGLAAAGAPAPAARPTRGLSRGSGPAQPPLLGLRFSFTAASASLACCATRSTSASLASVLFSPRVLSRTISSPSSFQASRMRLLPDLPVVSCTAIQGLSSL
jgi:tRNA uridine 5-carboxymethylaminomethyl modification enzyme